MYYIRLYRTIDFAEEQFLQKRNALSSKRYTTAIADDLNSFDHDIDKKHFFLSLYSAKLMQLAFPDCKYLLYSYDIPLELCLPYLGAGKYCINDNFYFFMEFALPLRDIAKFTKDYKALMPFLKNHQYYDEHGNHHVTRLIELHNMIYFKKCAGDVSLENILQKANEDYAKKIYEESSKTDYKLNVCTDDTYAYLSDKKLIRKL